MGWIVLPRDSQVLPTHGFVYIRHGTGVVWSTLLGKWGRSFPLFRSPEERRLWESEGWAKRIVPAMSSFSSKFTILTTILGVRVLVIDTRYADRVFVVNDEQIIVDKDLSAR